MTFTYQYYNDNNTTKNPYIINNNPFANSINPFRKPQQPVLPLTKASKSRLRSLIETEADHKVEYHGERRVLDKHRYTDHVVSSAGSPQFDSSDDVQPSPPCIVSPVPNFYSTFTPQIPSHLSQNIYTCNQLKRTQDEIEDEIDTIYPNPHPELSYKRACPSPFHPLTVGGGADYNAQSVWSYSTFASRQNGSGHSSHGRPSWQ